MNAERLPDDWWECQHCGLANPPGVDCARCRDEAPDRDDPDGGGVGSITPGYVSPDEYEANMEYYDHQHCLLYP